MTTEDSVYIKGLIKNKTYYYRIRPWSASCGYGNYIYDSFTTSKRSECFGSTDTIQGGFENSAGWSDQNTSSWTLTDTFGNTYSSYQARATSGDAYTGTRKIEYNVVGGWFELPVSNYPSKLSFYAKYRQPSSKAHTISVQYYQGSAWNTLSNISITSNSYQKYSFKLIFNWSGQDQAILLTNAQVYIY